MMVKIEKKNQTEIIEHVRQLRVMSAFYSQYGKEHPNDKIIKIVTDIDTTIYDLVILIGCLSSDALIDEHYFKAGENEGDGV
jgi:hypothetical protein